MTKFLIFFLSGSLSHYFISTTSRDVFSGSSQNRNETPTEGIDNPQYDDIGTGLMFTNPIADTFDLQHNISYTHESATPTTVAHVQEREQVSLTPDHTTNVDHTHSSSVMIADNPQYWQFSLTQQQTLSDNEGGVASSNGGVVSVVEGDYDYPTSFRSPSLVNSDPYSQVRTTSDEPAYTTINGDHH